MVHCNNCYYKSWLLIFKNEGFVSKSQWPAVVFSKANFDTAILIIEL